ncbi:MAG: PEPxxWA-CTERM sorting domain-containing protein [Caulobacteraceae bacterium]
MYKLIPAALAAVALFAASTAANAASMLFQFDAANSSITVSGNGDRTCFPSSGCALTANLLTPFSNLTIDEGASQTFNFASLNIGSGWGFDSAVQVDATLAFVTPDAGPASSTGDGSYFHLQGIFGPSLSGGALTWNDPVQQFTTPDGSKFTVTFNDIKGLEVGSNALATVNIAVDSVAAAVPEPGTWGLLIVGVGMMGVALRRRSAKAFAA